MASHVALSIARHLFGEMLTWPPCMSAARHLSATRPCLSLRPPEVETELPHSLSTLLGVRTPLSLALSAARARHHHGWPAKLGPPLFSCLRPPSVRTDHSTPFLSPCRTSRAPSSAPSVAGVCRHRCSLLHVDRPPRATSGQAKSTRGCALTP